MAARRNLPHKQNDRQVRRREYSRLVEEKYAQCDKTQKDSSSKTDSSMFTATGAPLSSPSKREVANLKEFEKGDDKRKRTHVTFNLPQRTGANPERQDTIKHSGEGSSEEIKEKILPIDQEKFDEKHGFTMTDLSLVNRIVFHFSVIRTWGRLEWFEFLKCRVPLLSWLPAYDWTNDFVFDLVGGIMVSILYIPQGLAYGLIVGVPPILGIYSGVVAPIVYVCLGTSRHASTGAFAIVALMAGSVVEQVDAQQMADSLQSDPYTSSLCCSEGLPKIDPAFALKVSTLLTFYVGLIQVILGLLNAGILAVWLSDQLVEGLTTGAAVHVLASQIKIMTGVENVPRTSDFFGIVKFIICFIRNASTVKYQTALCSMICCTCLLVSNLVIDPAISQWTTFRFPMELALVIFLILLCYLGTGTPYDLKQDIVGGVDSSIPPPSLPDFSVSNVVIGPAISIAIVSFVIHIALAKLIAKEMKYQISANQEWLALGAMHCISSCFGCFPGGSSLSRTLTNASLKTRSQLSSVIVAAILVVVSFGAAPVFKYLPKTVLSCTIVIAMKDLYVKIYFSRLLMHQSIVDFLIYAVTFLSVVLINLNIGLVIGVVFALLTVVLRSQWAESTLLGRIPGTSDFKGIGHYKAATEIAGIKVFRFDAPLYFANAELFLSRMYSATGLDPLMLVSQLDEKRKDQLSTELDKAVPRAQQPGEVQLTVRRRLIQPKKRRPFAVERDEKGELMQLTHIVVDCSSFPYIDLMGVEALARAYREYAAINIVVYFANCKVAVRQMFQRTKFYEAVPKKCLFISLSDAISQAQYEQEIVLQMREENSYDSSEIQNKSLFNRRPQGISSMDANPQLQSAGVAVQTTNAAAQGAGVASPSTNVQVQATGVASLNADAQVQAAEVLRSKANVGVGAITPSK